MQCSICTENFNKSNHLPVDCKGCDKDEKACRTCCQTYILSSVNQEPCCLFCKTPWERDFMNSFLTKKFVNKDLKNHVENIFLEQQISLLPETQQAAKQEKQIRELKVELEKANVVLNQIKKAYSDQLEIIKSYNLNISRLKSGEVATEEPRNNFTHKCKLENCKGFLNNRHICQLCDTKFCGKCMEVKENEHECNEELVATVEAIKKQAKPCPSCGEMISKIDGCDQMWCVKCHVQFSWRTGNQMNGYNHNPEYFRWLRETNQNIPRNPFDDRRPTICGVNDRTLVRSLSLELPSSIAFSLEGIIRFYRHIEYTINNEIFQRLADNELKNFRIQFLLNDISKNEWKERIQKVNKSLSKQRSFSNVRRLIFNVLQNFVERMVEYRSFNYPVDKYNELLQEANDFRIYANTCFLKISDTYGSSSCPGILENWREAGNLKYLIKRRNTNP